MRKSPRNHKKSQRPLFKPLVEQMEDRRLLATWTVDDNFSGLGCNTSVRRCDTIQSAVDAATAGDRINVRAGTYDENVVVDKRLTIQAVGGATVDPVDDGVTGVPAYGFNLQANDIVIRNFRIGDFNSDAGLDGSVGINASSSFSGYKIQGNLIAQNVFGIYLNTATSNDAHQTVVSGNTLRSNNVGSGVLPAAGNGIYSDQGARNVKITGNRFFGHDNEDVIFVAPTSVETGTSPLQIDIAVKNNSLLSSSGVYFVNVQRSQISFNQIRNSNFNAIELPGGDVGITIRGNTLRNVGTQGFNGIYLYRRELAVGDFITNGPNSNNEILNNTVINAGLTGIRVRDSAFNAVRGNTVTRSKGFDLSDPAWGNGITLQAASNNRVESNVVTRNARHGIYVDAGSSDNLIKSNVSLDNARVDPAGFDYDDQSTGDGTAGTDNTYQNNVGRTQNRAGLIRFRA